MNQSDIVWTSYPPEPDQSQISCSFDLPSGKAVLLTLWAQKEELWAHVVNRRTGLVVMPIFCRRDDSDMLESQAWRYGEPLVRWALH